MLDDIITRLETIREHKFTWLSEKEIKNILVPLTLEGEGEREVYEIFRDNLLNSYMINTKPIFWGAIVRAPFYVVGNAGTVNSGAFDDFKALRKITYKEDLWLHVDGAFGAWLKLSDTHRNLVDGMELADSLAVDLHKWMDMPYGIGCTLVKDKISHYSTFVYGHEAEYIKSGVDLTEDVTNNPHSLSLQLSRNNNSLRAYMLLRAYGKKKYSRLVQQNIDQINFLADLINSEPNFELMAPVISNVVCFRYNPGGLSEDLVEKLNKKF